MAIYPLALDFRPNAFDRAGRRQGPIDPATAHAQGTIIPHVPPSAAGVPKVRRLLQGHRI